MSDMSRRELGRRIRALRKAKGYTSMETFAQALGVSWITVSRYERGVGSIPDERLHEIATLLGTTRNKLLDGLGVAA